MKIVKIIGCFAVKMGILLFGLNGAVQAAPKTFVYCSEGSPSAFNPQITTDGTSSNASSKTVYSRLVDFKYGTTEVISSLALNWKVSKDGLHYTFILRKGVKFHATDFFKPTREFNADDVLFSFNRMRDPNHPYYQVNGGTYEYFSAMEMGKLIKDIKKIDPYHVEFILNYPEAPFLANMAMAFASILSKEYADKLLLENKQRELDHKPIGTGPFIFKKYMKDTIIRFEANPEYFFGKPKIDQLVFSITPDASVRVQKLKAGECHFIAEPSAHDVEALASSNQFNILKNPGLNVGYLAMNSEKKPFDNVLVRKAIYYALNRKSYIEAIYLGQAVVAKNPLPPTIWSYNNSIKDYEYSPEKAKKLLVQAGFSNGFSTELWTLPVSRPYNPNGKKMGEMIQADLAKVGIKVKLVTFDWPTYLSKTSNGEHAMVEMGWTGDNGDPDNFLNVLLGCAAVKAGSNLARWCYEPFNNLMEQAKKISSQNKRAELYKKAQVIFHDQVPWVPIAHSIVFRAMNKKVKGYKVDPLGHDVFYEVDLK